METRSRNKHKTYLKTFNTVETFEVNSEVASFGQSESFRTKAEAAKK